MGNDEASIKRDKGHAIAYGVLFGVLVLVTIFVVSMMFTLRSGILDPNAHRAAASSVDSSASSSGGAGQAVGTAIAVSVLVVFYFLFYVVHLACAALYIPCLVVGIRRYVILQKPYRTYYLVMLIASAVLLASTVGLAIAYPLIIA